MPSKNLRFSKSKRKVKSKNKIQIVYLRLNQAKKLMRPKKFQDLLKINLLHRKYKDKSKLHLNLY